MKITAIALLMALALPGLACAACGAPGRALQDVSWNEVDAAVWPAEVVQLADDFLSRHPQAEQRDVVRAAREAAAGAMQVLQRRDVRLHRSAFCGETAPPETELRRAARGDKAAALGVAHRYGRGDGVAPDLNRYEGWLQFASLLGSDTASYELALHFRRQGQPAFSAVYEARAVELGYVLPAALDNIRK